MFLSTMSLPGAVAFSCLAAWLLQKVCSGVFNLFYHPIAVFPGPKAAAITAWYKTYQEVFLGRSWAVVLRELHGEYGMLRNT
jgi:hypothetical protein